MYSHFKLPAGNCNNVPSSVCEACNDSLQIAYKIFIRASESTRYLVKHQNQIDSQNALLSRNGESAASIKPSGTKTYFSNDEASEKVAIEVNFLMNCDEMLEETEFAFKAFKSEPECIINDVPSDFQATEEVCNKIIRTWTLTKNVLS